MTLLARISVGLGNLGFHLFLAAYWYLVHALYPHYALMGSIAAYALYRLLEPRWNLTLPQPALLLLAALLFFLMLNPLQSLIGLPQLCWFVITATGFRLSFAWLESRSFKAGALLASYVLFLALPMGLPRFGSTAPSVEDEWRRRRREQRRRRRRWRR